MHVLPVVVFAALAPTVVIAQQGGPQESPVAAIKAAGTDVAKLLQLATAWTDKKQPDAAQLAWKRVLELDPDNAQAREGLRHQFYDGKWFETHTALFAYKKAEDARMAKQGLARLNDRWVPIADAPFLRLGWERDANNAWIHPVAKARLLREQDLVAKGFQQQDLEWVDPADFELWKQGLWKCGNQWLDNAAADAWHADATHPWLVAGEHFVVKATVDRARVEWCRHWADQAWADLVRIFGVEPGSRPSAIDLLGPQRNKPQIIVLSSLQQYNAFAAGDPARQVMTAESEGLSSLHYAFFADVLGDASVSPPAYAGVGVAVWQNSTPALDAFGQHAVRHAAGQSFVEAIDPSFNAIGDLTMANFNETLWVQKLWAEKKIPRWLHYGAASYVERYFLDQTVSEGGKARWARDWALAQLRKAGGLRDMQKVFDFKITTADVPGSTQMIHEAGLLVAFLLDGEDKRVRTAHQAFQAALRAGGATASAVNELQRALLAAKPALAKFAGG